MAVSVLFSAWILILHIGRRYVQAAECGYPGAPAFGRPHPVKEVYRPGEAVSFTCAHGYALQGPLQRLCASNGTWAGALPLCDRSLSSVDQHASSRQTLSLYPANKSIDGDPRTCTYTDKLRPRWIRVDLRSNQRVRAVAITVPQGIYSQEGAQLTIYAIRVRDSTTASYHKCASFNGRFATSTLQLSCAGGEVEGRYVHVEDNRHRVDYFSLCEIQVYVNKGTYECGEADRPAHAYSVRTPRGDVEYRCVYGYRLEGPGTRICEPDGQWSPQQPICKEIVCQPLPEVDHGRLHYVGRKSDRLTLGTMANVSCEYGYHPSSTAPIVCEEDGHWNRRNVSCLPVDCGMPSVRHASEQHVLLNGTLYGSGALLRCGDLEATLLCREDGTWTVPDFECVPEGVVSTLGLIEEEQSDVPTGIVIGMAVVVFLLLITVIFVLLLKRKKVLRQSSTDSLPSKETTPSSAAHPYENEAFYATIPADGLSKKSSILSTVLFPKRKSPSRKSQDDSSAAASCIYEEIDKRSQDPPEAAVGGAAENPPPEAVYAQVDLEEKRRSRLVKSLFEPVDPPPWENTYRPEDPLDEVDLEPIKLRELPPIPDETGSGVTYASLALDDPPVSRKNEIYEESPPDTVMKDNELYRTNAKA